MKIIKPKTSKTSADWVTGEVYPTIVLDVEEPSRVRIGSVHFAIWGGTDNDAPETVWSVHVATRNMRITRF